METIGLFGLQVYPYGAAVALAAAVALCLAGLLTRHDAPSRAALSYFAVLAVPLGLACARLGYIAVSIDWVLQEGAGFFFRFREGGFLLYGAMGGCLVAAWLACRVTKAPLARFLDRISVPGMLLIALCRLAEGLCGVGYGWSVEEWFLEGNGMSLIALDDPALLCRFPFAALDYYGAWNWAVFVLEAIVALGVMIAAMRVRVRRDGGRFALCLLLYCCTQVLCESLRQDAVLRWGFVRVNQIIGAVLTVLLLIAFIRLSGRSSAGAIARSAAGLVGGALLVIAMEFALEGKISVIEWMTMDVCYGVMACGCALMIASVMRFWRSAFCREEKEASA